MHRSLSLLALLAFATPAFAGPADAAPGLHQLAPMMGLKLGRRDVRRLEAAAADERPAVRALAVAMLFARDPDGWREQLAEVFAVPDHAGATRVVDPGEVKRRVAEHAAAFGGAVPPEFEPLLAFLAYKDEPAGFETPEGTTSVAKFYRQTFLALAWAEAESRGRVDRKRVLWEIDQAASAASAPGDGDEEDADVEPGSGGTSPGAAQSP